MTERNDISDSTEREDRSGIKGECLLVAVVGRKEDEKSSMGDYCFLTSASNG